MIAALCLFSLVSLGAELPTDLGRLLAVAPAAADRPADDAVYLRREVHREVDATGRTRSLRRETILILRAGGVHHREQLVGWTTPSQTVTVGYARTVRPDGRLVDVTGVALQAETIGRYGETFGDVVRWKLAFPYVEPGAVVDYEVTIADNRVTMPEGFADFCELQALDPVLSASYTVRTPSDRVPASYVHGDLAPPVVRPRGAVTDMTWQTGELAPLAAEPRRPPDVNQSLWILVTCCPNWNAVADAYRTVASTAYVAHTPLRQAVKRILTGSNDPVRSLYEYVCTSIRYGVGPLERRAPGSQPRPAYETFDLRVGDCKDQATLLLTMLREAGIRAYPALLRRNVDGPVIDTAPTILQFDHVVVAVPQGRGRWRWLDPTWSYGPADSLPPDIQGVKALVIEDDQSRWVSIPSLDGSGNVHDRSSGELRVSTDGTLRGSVVVTARGGLEQSLRWLFHGLGPAVVASEMAGALAATLPAVRVEPESVDLTPADAMDQPFQLRYQFSSTGYALRTQTLLIFQPAVFERETAVSAPEAARRYPLRLAPSPERRVNRLRFRLDPGLETLEVPTDRSRHESFGWFRVTYRLRGDTLDYTREVELTQPQLAAEEVPRWYDWRAELAECDRQVVVLRRLER